MKRVCLLFVLLPVCGFGATFERWYGGNNEDGGYGVCQTPDGGYIAVGRTNSFGQGQEDVYIIRADSLGDTLWTRTYGSPVRDFGMDIFPVNDGYVIVGFTGDMTTYCDVYLLRINSSGDTIWTKTIDIGGNFDLGYTGALTNDNGFIIVGYTAMGSINMCAIKTDSAGDVLWGQIYGTGGTLGIGLDLTNDGGYIFSGATGLLNPPEDVYLVKTDSVGDTLWTRIYDGIGENYGYDVHLTSDSGFIIFGSTASFTPDTDVYVIKTNSQGDTLWTRHYGGSYKDEGIRGFESSDGGYVVAGYTNSFGSGTPYASNAYIIKIDNTGNLLWERIYGDSLAEDYVYSGSETSDYGYIFAGGSRRDFYLLKTDSTGMIGVEENNYPASGTDYRLNVFPNPSYGWIDIKYEIPYCHSEQSEESIRLTIYDVAGRAVDKVSYAHFSPGAYTVRYETHKLMPGIYFISLNDSVSKQKLIVLN